MLTAQECLWRANDLDVMAEFTRSEGVRRSYLAQAEHWRRLAASPTLDPQTRKNFMADDPNNRGPQDRARINMSQPHEVSYWTQKWGVSADRLREAVTAVGTSADAVAKYLEK